MNRRGVALLTVLWLLVILSGLGAVSMVAARDGSNTTRNRVWLRRAEWAREACGEILRARWADSSQVQLDSIDLGRGTWCAGRLDNPSARLNINTADSDALLRLLASSALTDALVDWRDPDTLSRPEGAEASWYRAQRRQSPRNGWLSSVDELRLVKGFDSVTVDRLAGLVTTDGDGTLDLNAAPLAVLGTLAGFDQEVLEQIQANRSQRHPLGSLEELASQLSPSAQRDLLASYQSLQQTVVVAPHQLLGVVEGHITGTPIRASGVLLFVPADHRLAVVGRRLE